MINKDLKNIKITLQLAELCGIIAGDGHLGRYISKKRTDYKVQIFGHKEDDYEYLRNVQKLLQNIFNIDVKFISRNNLFKIF